MRDDAVEHLFEGAFASEGLLCRVDVLHKVEDGLVDLIEVKATNAVKPEHLADVGFQLAVLEGAGLVVRSAQLMHFDPEYVLKTTDAGQNWVAQNPHIDSWISSIDFAPDGMTGYVVGGAGVISKTTNGGDSWIVMPSPTANNLQAVHFPFSPDTGFTVGRYGTILWTTSGGVPGIEESPKPQAASSKPAATVVRGVLMVGRQSTANGSRQELLDAAGRRVMELRAGPNDVSQLAHGVYFLTERGARSTADVLKIVTTR
jgi:photosystem II stability/assembly factor-like uncharacterized protein